MCGESCFVVCIVGDCLWWEGKTTELAQKALAKKLNLHTIKKDLLTWYFHNIKRKSDVQNRISESQRMTNRALVRDKIREIVIWTTNPHHCGTFIFVLCRFCQTTTAYCEHQHLHDVVHMDELANRERLFTTLGWAHNKTSQTPNSHSSPNVQLKWHSHFGVRPVRKADERFSDVCPGMIRCGHSLCFPSAFLPLC